MVLKYRISLPGIKGFARVYLLRPTTTLYEFQLAMTADMEFAHDQLIQFKALDEAGGLVARYSMFDLGAGTVDTVTMADTVKKGIVSFVYFYEVTARKSVNVTYEDEVEEEAGASYPLLLSELSLGPNPEAFENGYVAYVDLPEDQKHPKHHEVIWDKDSNDGDKDFDDDEDLDDDADDDDDEDEKDDDEDGEEIYDESEGVL